LSGTVTTTTPTVIADVPAASSVLSGRVLQFGAIVTQLALLLVVFWLFRLEEPAFLVLSATVFAGFTVSYWLPLTWKEPFFVALCIGGALLIAEPVVVFVVIALLASVFAIARMNASYRVRVSLLGALLVALTVARQFSLPGLPAALWPTIGAVFMFRLIVIMYDLRGMKEPPSFTAFAAYFLMLPNFYFLFFPVVDYQTMRKGFARREIGDIAQSGVQWIVRGALQLMLYRVILLMKGELSPANVTSLMLLVKSMVVTYLLYLHVSGTFHIIVGMLHLFGYDLPETHRRYLLASSVSDFWRRINIYWKDFMMKTVYLPVFFRLRKSGPVRAQLIGTSLVFVATWALHAYQYYWLTGSMLLSGPDIAFWSILGAWVVVNLALEIRARDTGASTTPGTMTVAFKTAATFSVIVVLWSMWSSTTLAGWLDLMTYWKVG
jgi:hypothetical protein